MFFRIAFERASQKAPVVGFGSRFVKKSCSTPNRKKTSIYETFSLSELQTRIRTASASGFVHHLPNSKKGHKISVELTTTVSMHFLDTYRQLYH